MSDSGAMNVLFLCTGNSARSIMAEVVLNALGGGRFRAYSAGSHPTGTVNPAALDELARRGHDTSGLHSKSWRAFAGDSAPEFGLVFTVCDNAANESCPVWHGSPITVHWGIPDPARVTEPDDAVRDAFRAAYDRLSRRIAGLVALPIEAMSVAELRAALDALGDADP